MATTALYTCKLTSCGKTFEARVVDRNRGWALFCSKSCKAIEQESRTHQHRDFINGVKPSRTAYTPSKEESERRDYEEGLNALEAGWDGHKDAF